MMWRGLDWQKDLAKRIIVADENVEIIGDLLVCLDEIAAEDYRGPRPAAAVKADEALNRLEWLA